MRKYRGILAEPFSLPSLGRGPDRRVFVTPLQTKKSSEADLLGRCQRDAAPSVLRSANHCAIFSSCAA